jgi:hypothetical protein
LWLTAQTFQLKGKRGKIHESQIAKTIDEKKEKRVGESCKLASFLCNTTFHHKKERKCDVIFLDVSKKKKKKHIKRSP